VDLRIHVGQQKYRLVDPARNHFDLPDDLAAGDTPLGAAVLAQLGVAP